MLVRNILNHISQVYLQRMEKSVTCASRWIILQVSVDSLRQAGVDFI